MSATIPLPLAKWLQQQHVLPRREPAVYPAPGFETKLLTVKSTAWRKFQNGCAIPKLVCSLDSCALSHSASGIYVSCHEELEDKLREALTATSMLYNWNVLGPVLQAHGIFVSDETKARIVAGDTDPLVLVLQEIQEKASMSTETSGFPVSEGIQTSQSGETYGKVISGVPDAVESRQPILLDALRAQKMAAVLPLLLPGSPHEREASSIAANEQSLTSESTGGCKTVVEFFVQSLCKEFKVTSRGAALMLTVHAPRLVGLCTEGPFKAVKRWLLELSSSVTAERVIGLITKQPDDINILFQILKPCFLSSNSSVVMHVTVFLNRLLANIRHKVLERKKTGMMPSSKNAYIKPQLDRTSSKHGDIFPNSARLDTKPMVGLQALAREQARTPLEKALNTSWVWFKVGVRNGFTCILNASKNHPSLNKELTQLACNISSDHFQELLQVHFRKAHDVEMKTQLAFLYQFVSIVSETKHGRQ